MNKLLIIIALAVILGFGLNRILDDSIDDQNKGTPDGVRTGEEYNEWEDLGEFDNEAHAQIVADWLKSEGIPAVSQTENPNITEGASFLLNQRVRVPSVKLTDARHILKGSDFEEYLTNDRVS